MSSFDSSTKKKRGLPGQMQMRHGSHFVEELTRGSEETQVGLVVPISKIQPDQNQPRSSMGDLSELVASVQRHGILEPVLLRKLDSQDLSANYQIISGERRYRAAMEAGLEDVPAIILTVDDEEALEIGLIENLQRKDLTAFEEAEGYRTLSEVYGLTHEEIAKRVGKSRSSITESLMLTGIPSSVREAANALGVSAKTTLLEVLKEESPEEMISLLERIGNGGVSREDLRNRRQKSTQRPSNKFRYSHPEKKYTVSISSPQGSINDEQLLIILEEILSQIRSRLVLE